MAEKQTYKWSFTGPVEYAGKMRPGEPYAGIVSDEHASAIEAILILWSEYENRFDAAQQLLYRFLAVDPKEWERLAYRRQANFMLERLAEKFPDRLFRALFMDIFERAKIVYDKRNSLAHGRYEWTARVEDSKMVPIVRTVGMVQRQEVEFEFSASDLLDLRYEIANIAGRLGAIVSNAASNSWLPTVLPSDEISLLQGIFSNKP